MNKSGGTGQGLLNESPNVNSPVDESHSLREVLCARRYVLLSLVLDEVTAQALQELGEGH